MNRNIQNNFLSFVDASLHISIQLIAGNRTLHNTVQAISLSDLSEIQTKHTIKALNTILLSSMLS